MLLDCVASRCALSTIACFHVEERKYTDGSYGSLLSSRPLVVSDLFSGYRFYASKQYLQFYPACLASFLNGNISTLRPSKAYFDFIPPLYEPPYPYTCQSRYIVKLVACVINVFCDLLTVLLPIPLAWNLRLPLRQRLAVIATFGLGAAVVVVSALKTKYLVSSVRDSYDEQWDAYPLWICGIIELDVSLICASAPALRPLVIRYFPDALGTIRSSYRKSTPPGILEAAAAKYDIPLEVNNRDSDQSFVRLKEGVACVESCPLASP